MKINIKYKATTTTSDAPRIQIDSLLIGLILVATLLVFVVLWTRSHLPSAGFLAAPSQTGETEGWKINQISRDEKQGGVPREWLGATVVRACETAKTDNASPRCVDLKSEWMIDSPIALPSTSAIHQFIKSQNELLLISKIDSSLTLHAKKQESQQEFISTVKLTSSREYFNERFSIVIITAVVIYLVGCSMLAFVRRSGDVWWAFAMCTGFFLFMLMRGWYTSRTWAQPETGWWIAITVFRIGVMLCSCASIIVLWNVRLKIHKKWPLTICAVMCSVVFLHGIGWIESAFLGYRLVTLGMLIVIVGLGLSSWWLGHRGGQGEKLRARTFGSILGIGFLPVMITMPIWTFRPDLLQISYLQNLAVGMAGIPVIIIVAHSAQYQLHEFWWRLWLVLITSVLGLVGSTVIVVFSGMSATPSMIAMTTLAAVTIYFLRDWLERHLVGKPPALEGLLPQVIRIQALNDAEFELAWRDLLHSAFAPKEINLQSDVYDITLFDQGNAMNLPAIGASPALELLGAANYTRSFSHADVRLARSLHTLIAQGLAARASFTAGAVQERKRIAADLHDDIGGRLLRLANAGGAEGAYARSTLEDLRTITRGLSAEPREITELLADLRYALGQRVEHSSIDFNFEAKVSDEIKAIHVGPLQSTVLFSICSELLRNAMQHQCVSHISFLLQVERAMLIIVCNNDGKKTDPTQWKRGLGTTSIRRRVNDLRGQCQWLANTDGGAIFRAQLPLDAWLRHD